MDYKLFHSIACATENSLYKLLPQFLKKQGYTTVLTNKEKDYIYAVGDFPIALVAHIDTVFYENKNKEIFFDSSKKTVWSPDGLGADDRAGVYAIVELLRQFKGGKPSIIFTNKEERGLLGAQAFVEDFPLPISDINYLIELDRRNKNDCVFYDCMNEIFQSYIESFGFKTKEGIYSDICVICETWQIAGVNLSVGYFNEHTECEYLNLGYLDSTIKKVLNLLDAAFLITKPFDYMPRIDISGRTCDCCGGFYHDWQIIPFREQGKLKWYCDSCITQCNSCGKEISKSMIVNGMCPTCNNKEVIK